MHNYNPLGLRFCGGAGVGYRAFAIFNTNTKLHYILDHLPACLPQAEGRLSYNDSCLGQFNMPAADKLVYYRRFRFIGTDIQRYNYAGTIKYINKLVRLPLAGVVEIVDVKRKCLSVAEGTYIFVPHAP